MSRIHHFTTLNARLRSPVTGPSCVFYRTLWAWWPWCWYSIWSQMLTSEWYNRIPSKSLTIKLPQSLSSNPVFLYVFIFFLRFRSLQTFFWVKECTILFAKIRGHRGMQRWWHNSRRFRLNLWNRRLPPWPSWRRPRRKWLCRNGRQTDCSRISEP